MYITVNRKVIALLWKIYEFAPQQFFIHISCCCWTAAALLLMLMFVDCRMVVWCCSVYQIYITCYMTRQSDEWASRSGKSHKFSHTAEKVHFPGFFLARSLKQQQLNFILLLTVRNLRFFSSQIFLDKIFASTTC